MMTKFSFMKQSHNAKHLNGLTILIIYTTYTFSFDLGQNVT